MSVYSSAWCGVLGVNWIYPNYSSTFNVTRFLSWRSMPGTFINAPKSRRWSEGLHFKTKSEALLRLVNM